jgi:hypothetical protein
VINGGLFIMGTDSDITLFNATVDGIEVTYYQGYGGAIYLENSNYVSTKGSLTINNSTFQNC